MEATSRDRERRRTPRVTLLADLFGHVMALDEPVRISQMSLGGMTVEIRVPLSPHEPHDFRLSYEDRSLVLKADVVHSRARVDGDDVTYVTGVAFRDPSPADLELIRQMVEAARDAGA